MNGRDVNLNALEIETDGPVGHQIGDNEAQSGVVFVHFRKIETALCGLISESRMVFGCIAWLTNRRLLDALSKVGCSIVVQKEDFLRPDSRGSKEETRRAYDRLRCPYDRCQLPGFARDLSSASDQTVDAIRCCGQLPQGMASPRMHHKFAVFCTIGKGFQPFAVATGSFNWTFNSNNSFENLVIIRDGCIAEAYLREWSQIFALSEPLNWESEWTQPEWRLGT